MAELDEYTLPPSRVSLKGSLTLRPSCPPVDIGSIPLFELPCLAVSAEEDSLLAEDVESFEGLGLPVSSEGPYPVPARRPSPPPLELRSIDDLEPLPPAVFHSEDACLCGFSHSRHGSSSSMESVSLGYLNEELPIAEDEDMIFVMDGYDEPESPQEKDDRSPAAAQSDAPFKPMPSAAFAAALGLGDGSSLGYKWDFGSRDRSPRTASPCSTAADSEAACRPSRLLERCCQSIIEADPARAARPCADSASSIDAPPLRPGFDSNSSLDFRPRGRVDSNWSVAESLVDYHHPGNIRWSTCSTRTSSPVVLGQGVDGPIYGCWGESPPRKDLQKACSPSSLSRALESRDLKDHDRKLRPSAVEDAACLWWNPLA